MGGGLARELEHTLFSSKLARVLSPAAPSSLIGVAATEDVELAVARTPVRLLHGESPRDQPELSPARLHQIIFNRVNKMRNQEATLNGIHSPFGPTNDDFVLMNALAGRLLDLAENSPKLAQDLFYNFEPSHSGRFKARYLTAFQQGASRKDA